MHKSSLLLLGASPDATCYTALTKFASYTASPDIKQNVRDVVETVWKPRRDTGIAAEYDTCPLANNDLVRTL